MKYSVEVLIEKPRDEVIKKMDNLDNMKHWQKGLVSSEHVSGTPGQVGAKMQLNYKMGKRELSLVETITKNNFPEEFSATYNTKGMHNIQENSFKDSPEGHYKWISNCVFQPSCFMMKAIVFFMPGSFKKQSKKYMIDFKNFVDKGISFAYKL